MNKISSINEERFNQHVVPILEILKKFDIKFWIDFGTLLGAIRDNVISDWDHDFDVSVLDVDREKLILSKELLEKKGYKVVLQKNIHWFEDLMQIYIPREQDVTDSKGRFIEGFDHVDIYIYTLIGDVYSMRRLHEPVGSFSLGMACYKLFRMINKSEVRYSDAKISLRHKPIMLVINLLPYGLRMLLSGIIWKLYIFCSKSAWLISPDKFFSEFTSIALYGYNLDVPKQFEKYLEFRYSDKWRKPDPNWDVTNNGGCIHKRIKSKHIRHISVKTVSNFDKYLWE